ncbi:MAG: type II toxin-antitoxin system RelB/DinJ family antitoxin [Bifidobacteriaceae bacterium]|jgi:DNA-damage-inducible protein J|nr:type II toxin-antitoxin system RelB/DinJ family antitoxin [Bifidobacteriaceae bacterium]
MAKTLISVRTDAELKERSQKLFADLGLDLSTAVNMFLRQSLVDNGIPFRVSKERQPGVHLDVNSGTPTAQR